MTMSWRPPQSRLGRPAYRSLAEAVSEAMDAGRLRPGDRLPAQRDLARDLGLALPTVTRAYRLLRDWGLVSGEVGRGTYVLPRPEPDVDMYGEPASLHARTDLIDLASRTPLSVHGREAQALKAALDRVSGRADLSRLMRAWVAVGPSRAVAAMAPRLASLGIDAPAERVGLTSGPQHAVVAILLAALKPGDTLLTEAETYPGVRAAASALRVRVEPVRTDDDGLVPEALDDACARTRAKALYCIPTAHPVTAHVTRASRRRRIAQIAARRDLLIIEEDDDSLTLEAPPPPLAALAPERVCYVLDSNKALLPGLGVAWCVVPESLASGLERAIRLTIGAVSGLVSETTAELIESGDAAALCAWRRRELEVRGEALIRALGGRRGRAPRGAHHVRVRLVEKSQPAAVVAAAREAGVRLTHWPTAAVSPGLRPRSITLSLSAEPSRERFLEGLRRVAPLLAGDATRSKAERDT